MRRVTLWIASTISALVLLFSYHTSTSSAGAQASALAPVTPGAASTATATPDAAGTTTDDSSTTDSGTGGGTASSPTPSASASSSASAKAATGTSGTFTGSSVDTRWGPVQVKITVKNGTITDVQAVVYPSGNGRDQEINSYALPVLHDEVIQAQSASIDAVGGATVTSDGYIGSLQSAVDAAHLGS